MTSGKTPPFKTIFMGCPEFAVPSLKLIAADKRFDLQAVFCMPPKPAGRRKKLTYLPVDLLAKELGLVLRTPSSFKKNPEEIDFIRELAPDFIVVTAYGLILPPAVLEIPKIAPINLHASVLPLLRGAAPIHYALMQGFKETGNSVMLMNDKMDEGDVLSVEKIPIEDTDTSDTLVEKLADNGARLLVDTLIKFAAGEITPQPQDHSAATYCSKVTPMTAKIDWTLPAEALNNHVRAMSSSPGAWFQYKGERIKVFKLNPKEGSSNAKPGDIIACCIDSGVTVQCGDNTAVDILELQRPGKSQLNARQFLCGSTFELCNLMDEY